MRVALVTSLLSTPVWACSFCTNTVLHQRYWWLGAIGPALALLLLEAAVRAAQGPRLEGWRRAGSLLFVALALIGGVGGALTAPVLGGAVVVGLLLLRATFVGAVTASEAPRGVAVRGLVLVLGLAGAVASSAPALRATPELVSLLTQTPFHFDDDCWALAQARTRPEALPELERKLSTTSADALAHQQLVLVELHALLGGDHSARAPLCRALAERRDLIEPRSRRRGLAACGWPETLAQ